MNTLRKTLARLIWREDYRKLQRLGDRWGDMLDHINCSEDGKKVHLMNIKDDIDFFSKELSPSDITP